MDSRRSMGWLALAFGLVALGACGSEGGTGSGGSASAGGGNSGGGGAGGGSSSAGGAGGSGGGEPRTPPGGLAACKSAWGKVCHEFEMCAPIEFVQLWGDYATCDSVMGKSCADFVYVGGDWTVADEQASADSRTWVDCNDFFRTFSEGADPTAACTHHGSRATGEACIYAGECKSDACAFPANATCGSCGPPRGDVGDPCDNATTFCKPGLACTGTCHAYGEIGDACDPTAPCHIWLGCLSGTCGVALADGDTCDPNAPVRDCALDHLCNPVTSQCEPITPQPDGATCGILDDGTIGNCGYGQQCKATMPAVVQGQCVPSVHEGGACNASETYYFSYSGACDYPLNCIGGKCVGTDQLVCP